MLIYNVHIDVYKYVIVQEICIITIFQKVIIVRKVIVVEKKIIKYFSL